MIIIQSLLNKQQQQQQQQRHGAVLDLLGYAAGKKRIGKKSSLLLREIGEERMIGSSFSVKGGFVMRRCNRGSGALWTTQDSRFRVQITSPRPGLDFPNLSGRIF